MTFVLLSPRQGRDVLAAEYEDFRMFTGLRRHELIQRPLDSEHSTIGDITGVTGVFIGGSPMTVSERFSHPEQARWQESTTETLLDFIDQAVDGRTPPVFAVCYAASMYAHYRGGTISSAFAESAGSTAISLTEEGLHDPICVSLPREFTGFTGHKDAVDQLPEGARLLATGPTCAVQLYRLGDQVWTSQFHPEMDTRGISRRLGFYGANGYYDAGERDAVFNAFAGVDTSYAHQLLSNFVVEARQRADTKASIAV